MRGEVPERENERERSYGHNVDSEPRMDSKEMDSSLVFLGLVTDTTICHSS